MPAVLAYMEEQKQQLDCRTPEGVYNRVLAKTGDVELAGQAMTEAEIQLKMATLPQGGMG